MQTTKLLKISHQSSVQDKTIDCYNQITIGLKVLAVVYC